MKALPQGIVDNVVSSKKKKPSKRSLPEVPFLCPALEHIQCFANPLTATVTSLMPTASVANHSTRLLPASKRPPHNFETLQHNSTKCSFLDTFSPSQGEAGSCTKGKRETANILQEVWPQDNGQRVSVAPRSPAATSVDKLHREYFKPMWKLKFLFTLAS